MTKATSILFGAVSAAFLAACSSTQQGAQEPAGCSETAGDHVERGAETAGESVELGAKAAYHGTKAVAKTAADYVSEGEDEAGATWDEESQETQDVSRKEADEVEKAAKSPNCN